MAIREAKPKPRNDAYTGLLAISFLALVGGLVPVVVALLVVGVRATKHRRASAVPA